jgi:3',5'-cyclic AMP phosphodiesterase CpdA
MANGNHVNAKPHPAPKEVEAHLAGAGPPCWVSQHWYGAPVNTVKQSTPTANNLYWLNYSGGKAAHTVDFVVTFKAGSPLNNQRQHFVFTGAGYNGAITTPFGVPEWGGNPILGPAVLTVLVNGVAAGTLNFTVTP